MATAVKLPRLGQGMESGTIVRWLKSEGETVVKREPLYELDTDKVTQEVEADVEGVLLRILVSSGEVDVGTTIAVIGEEGEDVASLVPADTALAPGAGTGEAEAAAAAEAEPSVPTEQTEQPPTQTPVAAGASPSLQQRVTSGPPATTAAAAGGRVKASPLARRMARERGIDLAAIAGTGPDGRVVAEDVERAAAGAPTVALVAAAPAPEIEVIELTTVRRTIARRLTEAWQAPVFQLGASADMTESLSLRERLVERTPEGDVTPTVNDVLVRLAAVALMRHPAVNAHFVEDRIERHRSANVGIAVAAPQGLIVPVIRDAGRLTVAEIARARADLVTRARDGKLTLQDLEGGTFTVSNLGMFGVEQFVAVLNPPQVAILAVGAIKETPVAIDGEIDVAPVMQLTLTCDHRAIDGADGAEFLRTVVSLLEAPATAL